jgi:hypothetical protein
VAVVETTAPVVVTEVTPNDESTMPHTTEGVKVGECNGVPDSDMCLPPTEIADCRYGLRSAPRNYTIAIIVFSSHLTDIADY